MEDRSRNSAYVAARRADMYLLASSAFLREPTEDALAHLIEACLEATISGATSASGMPSASVDTSCCREGNATDPEQALCEHIAGYAGLDLAELRTKVATEYAELFVGPRKPLAPLYESVYVDTGERMFTDSTMDVRRCYRAQGLEPVDMSHVPDDHMGLELEFASWLCRNEAGAISEGDLAEAQRLRDARLAFLCDHLLAWAEPFANRIADAWCGDYYAAWSRFVADYVAQDAASLKKSPSTGQEIEQA